MIPYYDPFKWLHSILLFTFVIHLNIKHLLYTKCDTKQWLYNAYPHGSCLNWAYSLGGRQILNNHKNKDIINL